MGSPCLKAYLRLSYRQRLVEPTTLYRHRNNTEGFQSNSQTYGREQYGFLGRTGCAYQIGWEIDMTRLWQMVSVSLVLVLVLAAMPPVVRGEVASPDSVGEAFQQEQDVLVYGEPVEGVIDNQIFTQAWSLESQAADRVQVRVERLDGNLIPDVSLQDLSGNSLSRSGADDTRAVATIRDYKLPGPGNYQVVVGRDRGETGETSGAYRLTVEALGLGVEHPHNTTIVDVVEYDTSVSGEITPEHWQHVYTLTGQTGDIVRITATRESGTLQPRVELQDVNGETLATGYADELGVTAAFNSYELKADGQFRVLVYRDRGIDGGTAGEYTLTARLLGAGEDSASLSAPPTPLEDYDEVQQGTITHARWYEDWQFTALASDLITITVTRLPGADNTLRPQVLVLGGAGQELRRGSVDLSGATAVIDRYKLSTPGAYTVRVLRERGKPGVTTGQYELRVDLLGSGEGSPILAPITGAVENGVPAEGEITHARWADSWTYAGQAGDRLDIVATRTDGTLVPRIEILDANQQSLRSGQVAATGDMASLLQYELPTSAEYYIVVSRDRGQDGATMGAYSLMIQLSE